jgi:hypothetical protein
MTHSHLIADELERLKQDHESVVAKLGEALLTKKSALEEVSMALDALEDDGWGVRVVDRRIYLSRGGRDLAFVTLHPPMISDIAELVPGRTRLKYPAATNLYKCSHVAGFLEKLARLIPARDAIEAIPDRTWNAQRVVKVNRTKRPGPMKNPVLVNDDGHVSTSSVWLLPHLLVRELEERAEGLIARLGREDP